MMAARSSGLRSPAKLIFVPEINLTRLFQEGGEFLVAPFAGMFFHGGGISEACLLGGFAVEDIPQIGADSIGPAFVESVAGDAFFRDALAAFDAGGFQKLGEGFFGCRGQRRCDRGDLGPMHADNLRWRIERSGGQPHGCDHKESCENPAQNFIQFEAFQDFRPKNNTKNDNVSAL